jgi:hypothetical protein
MRWSLLVMTFETPLAKERSDFGMLIIAKA